MFTCKDLIKPSMNSSSDVVLVDDIDNCREVVNQLLKEPEVAVDMEGVNLCRIGELCIIQICGKNTSVYIFDVVTLGRALFCENQGGLALLLENQSITKVVYDGRGDNDALYHQFNVKMSNVYDVQVLYVKKFNDRGDRYVKGLAKCLSNFGGRFLSASERTRLNFIKDKGVKLFAPEKGGSFEVWKQRPLKPELVKYAACDVRYLLDIKQKWGDQFPSQTIKAAAKNRIDKAVFASTPCKGPKNARIDWTR